MSDLACILTCGTCGHQVFHQFRNTRERLMRDHAKKHEKEKSNG